MSINLDTAGALVLQSSGTAASSKKMTILAPTIISANRTVYIPDPEGDTTLQFARKQYISVVSGVNLPLLDTDSGSTILIPNIAGALTVTLPAAAAGLHYDFLVTGATAGAIVTISGGGGNIVGGRIMTSAGAAPVSAVAGTLAATVKFAATAVIGDKISIFCDGTNWLYDAISYVAAGITSP